MMSQSRSVERETHAKKTFDRVYACDGAAFTAVTARRHQTLQRIDALKSSLASIVSSRSPSVESDRGCTPTASTALPEATEHHGLPAQRPPALSATTKPFLSQPPATRAVPERARGSSSKFLVEAQQQVERLTQENHELVRRCVDLEQQVHDRVSHQQSVTAAPSATAYDDEPNEEEVTEGVHATGSVSSPKETPFFRAHGVASGTSESSEIRETALHTPRITGVGGRRPIGHELPEAIHGLLHRLAVCYPELFQGIAGVSSPGVDNTGEEVSIISQADLAAVGDSLAATQTSTVSEEKIAELSEAGVCEVLWRLESVVPGLVSSSRLGDLFTDTGSQLLDRINTLEDEKQTDYFKVLDITDKLMRSNTQLKTQAAAQKQALAEAEVAFRDMKEAHDTITAELATERAAHESTLRKGEEENAAMQQKLAACESLQAAAEEERSRVAHESALERSTLAKGLQDNLAIATIAHESEAEDLRRQLSEATEARTALMTQHTTMREELDSVRQLCTAREAEYASQIQDLSTELAAKKTEMKSHQDASERAITQVATLSADAEATKAAQEQKDAHLSELEARLDSVTEELTQAKAEADSLSQQLRQLDEVKVASATALEAERIAALEMQLQAVTTEKEALAQQLESRMPPKEMSENLPNRSLADELSSPPEEENDDPTESSDIGVRDDSLSSPAPELASASELRKTKQSLKRVTHERTALKRKLERQNSLLADAQESLSTMELQVKMLESKLARSDAEGSAAQASSQSPQSSEIPHHDRRSIGDGADESAPALLDFSALEGTEGSRFYPETVRDILGDRNDEGWLLRLHDIPVQECLPDEAADARLRLQSAGYLYQVGKNMVRTAGLEDATGSNEHAWSRLLLQIQHSIEDRGSPVFSSSYAADCAQYYFALLRAAGILDDKSIPSPVRWALVVAGVCQLIACPLEGAGEDMSTARFGWTATEHVLRHVASVNEQDNLTSFFKPLVTDPSAEKDAVKALGKLLTLWDGTDTGVSAAPLGPHESGLLVASDASRLVSRCCCAENSAEEADAVSTDAVMCRAKLFLYLSRESLFLRRTATWPPGENSALLRFAQHVLGADSRDGTATGRLLLHLEGYVAPLAAAASRLLAGRGIKEGSAGGAAIMERLQLTHAALAAACTRANECLSQAELTSAGNLCTATANSDAVHDDKENAECQSRELLELYGENARYRELLTKLLSSIERKSVPLK